MKKWFYATMVLVIMSTPALADEFKDIQMKALDNISAQLEKYKNDAKKTNVLTDQKECVEKAGELDSIKACFAIYPLEPTKVMAK